MFVVNITDFLLIDLYYKYRTYSNFYFKIKKLHKFVKNINFSRQFYYIFIEKKLIFYNYIL